jgi:hypothetical protein
MQAEKISISLRCELKHKISTKMTGLDFVIKSLYVRNIRADSNRVFNSYSRFERSMGVRKLGFCVQDYM